MAQNVNGMVKVPYDPRVIRKQEFLALLLLVLAGLLAPHGFSSAIQHDIRVLLLVTAGYSFFLSLVFGLLAVANDFTNHGYEWGYRDAQLDG